MIAEYKFLRSHNRITGFAKVIVNSVESDAWEIVWTLSASLLEPAYGERTAATMPHLEREYGRDVQVGIELAAQEHKRRGGTPQRVEVLALIETLVDTTPDATACAAAMATWLSWGCDQADAEVVVEDERWQVRFTAVPATAPPFSPPDADGQQPIRFRTWE